MRISQSSVPIAELLSLSALTSKSFSNPGAILMIPSAVPRAARQGSQSATETVATEPHVRCFLQHAPSAARIPKYPLNLVVIGRCIVAIATEKSDQVDKLV